MGLLDASCTIFVSKPRLRSRKYYYIVTTIENNSNVSSRAAQLTAHRSALSAHRSRQSGVSKRRNIDRDAPTSLSQYSGETKSLIT